ncbi:MAG: endonuclease domain-containing protein [Chloroflexi bacterium]|nr:endonuclease domain-containing protein [Chloroflexota bacterium]
MSGYQRIRQPRDFKHKMHDLAGELRQRETLSEMKLWAALRSRQLEGRKFRRQVPVGGYVLDFYCAEENLAVEIDGGIHEKQQEADMLRQSALEELGVRFVRLPVEQVKNDFDSVLEIIKNAFQK